MQVEGGNNPNNAVHVDDEGKMQTRSVTITEQASKALVGETFNINTGLVTLTNDTETPLFYFKNTGESKPIILTRIFITFLTSTGGSGHVLGCVKRGTTGGTILDQDLEKVSNFNFGASVEPNAELRFGATNITETGGTPVPEFLFTGDNQRHIIPFDSITLPRGASALFTFTPPAGNTSIIVQAGANVYIDGDF